MNRLNTILKLTVVFVMLSRQAKHLALAEEKPIDSIARFFASLRFAQNDKLSYFLMNEKGTIANTIESVSLSTIVSFFGENV